MRVTFLAEKPCALTVNGAYFGIVDGFERSARLDPKDGVFCELSPAGYLSVRFRFDEDFLLSPPPQIKLYFSEGGAAVYAYDFARCDPSLSVLWQEHVSGSRLTLYMQGRLTLDLQNETGTHLVPLPEELLGCKPYACGEDILLEGESAFVLLGRDGTVKLRTEGKILEKGETLRAEIPFADSMGHSAVMEWKAGELLSCTIHSQREPTEATFALALFESALIGADCTPFLADSLKEKASSLRAFLGKYTSVVLTDDPARVGLVFGRGERTYDVRYFRVEFTDGKISNLWEDLPR